MENSSICPRKQIEDEDASPWIQIYGHYANGHLYRAGGVADQPAIYMEIMRLIDGAVKEFRNVS
jgi:hypothetical protein